MKRFLTATAAALALLLVAGMGAQAGTIELKNVSWTYNFTPGAATITADGNPTAGVSFTNEPDRTRTGSSTAPATNLTTFSSATSTNPDVLVHNGAYALNLRLSTTDETGVHAKTLTFHGKLSGTIHATGASVTNVFGSDAVQSVNLGRYTFTVTLNGYAAPGPAGGSLVGAMSAYVELSNLAPSDVTPEPGTMLLSGFGLSLLGGAAWRKRRQARLAVPA